MSGWEQRIVTGNPQADQATVDQHRQAAAAQGLAFDAQPLPGGGFHVRAYPAQSPAQGGYGQPQGSYGQPQGGYGQPQGGYGQPQGGNGQPQAGYGQPPAQAWGGGGQAYAAPGGMTFQSVSGVSSGGGGGVVVGGDAAAAPLTGDRVAYLRKVYGLLFVAVLVAGFAGFAATSLGPTVMMKDSAGHRLAVPILTSILLGSRGAMYAAFGVLFVATLGASAVSKVRGLNMVALFGVAALMGVELAPMVFVAQYYAAMGKTLSSAPVLGAFLGVASVFIGATSYVFVTRKDFSYLKATLNMGFWVVFAGCLITGIFGLGEVVALALCSVGAIVAGGMLLVQTSRIFRNSAMDDAVGDCLVLLVQLRNLFMFILRILMSSRR
jgi:modulator of FtsH protease